MLAVPSSSHGVQDTGFVTWPCQRSWGSKDSTEVLSPGLISPSSCITAAKFRRFTRNYHQQPSAPGLSEQVNDLSPGLCPRVTAITAGSASSQRSLPPHGGTRFSSSHLPPKATRDPTGVCAPRQYRGTPSEGTAPRSRRGYLPGVISQAWDIGKTPSIPPPPRLREGGRASLGTAQMSRAARQAPAAAARSSCPASKAIPEPRVQGVPGCLQARQQPQQNPSGMVDLEGYFKPLLK